MSKSPCWMSGRAADSCYYTAYKKKRVKRIWSKLAIVCSCLGGGQMYAPYYSVFFFNISPKGEKKISVNSDIQSRNKSQQALKS